MMFWGFNRRLILTFGVMVWLGIISVPALAQVSVCFGGNCFYPEAARTSDQKQRGLMERDALAEHEGMIFIYEQDIRPSFWMKNMRIPLDFVWLSADGKVVDLHQNIPPCEDECPAVISRDPLRYVLEIPAGMIQKTGIKIGDTARIQMGVKDER